MIRSTTNVGRNSFDKIVTAYFAGITREPIYHRGKLLLPKPLHISPGIFRHYTCPEACGACCPRFELLYLPSEPQPTHTNMEAFGIDFNGKTFLLHGDAQRDNDDHFCRNLIKETGRCGIHGMHPFSCDFELLRFTHYETHALLTQRLYARKWNMLNVIGTRGTSCEMIEQSEGQRDDLIRRLLRLKQWAEYFELTTRIDEVITWCESGPHTNPLVLE